VPISPLYLLSYATRKTVGKAVFYRARFPELQIGFETPPGRAELTTNKRIDNTDAGIGEIGAVARDDRQTVH